MYTRHAACFRAGAITSLGPLCAILPAQRKGAIAGALTISPGVVGKHVASIFAKLGLAPSDSDNRRVIAALKYLES